MRNAQPDSKLSTTRATRHLLPLLFASWLMLVPAQRAAAAESDNSCESCHGSPDFLVTNKPLYAYFQEWKGSVHRQEDVSCDECHGGDSETSDKDRAHAKGVGASDPSSGIHYSRVATTCGTCHDEILQAFRESSHFEQIAKKSEGKLGATCVTCHGSMASEVLDINTVAASCERCHNQERHNHPEVPERAAALLNRLLSINRFYRYITIRAEPDEAKAFFEKIDPRLVKLAVTWHTFDLERMGEETREVIGLLSAKRDEIRSRDKKK